MCYKKCTTHTQKFLLPTTWPSQRETHLHHVRLPGTLPCHCGEFQWFIYTCMYTANTGARLLSFETVMTEPTAGLLPLG